MEVITLLFLAVNSWKDCREKQISLLLTGIYALTGIGVSIWQGRKSTDFLIPLGIGLLILGLSILTNGEIGMGDSWILLALGTMLSTEVFLNMICIGMLLAGGYSGILLVLCCRNRRTEIPLVPFLLGGYVGGMLL